MFLALDTLEEKVFLMQVFFERLIIPRFRMIAAASPGTVLEDLCNRLTVDDGIHHSSGMAYERVLLQDASRAQTQQLVKIANRMLPIFVDHSLWRPKARASIAGLDARRATSRCCTTTWSRACASPASLGIDVSDLELPSFA